MIDEQYFSVLVAVNAALLLILAGVAKRQLEWKRPALQPIARRRWEGTPVRQRVARRPRSLQIVLIVGICIGGAVAGGAGIAGAVTPVAAAAYVAAATFVFFATR